MAQLGHLSVTLIDNTGASVSGATITVYREGATVDQVQTITAPGGAVTLDHAGDVAASDSIFLNTTTGTTFNVDSVDSSTQITISGLASDLSLAAQDRLIPNNSRPSIYASNDDQGAGAAISNSQISTNSQGLAECFTNSKVVDYIINNNSTLTLVRSKFVSGDRIIVQQRNPFTIYDTERGNDVFSVSTQNTLLDTHASIGVRIGDRAAATILPDGVTFQPARWGLYASQWVSGGGSGLEEPTNINVIQVVADAFSSNSTAIAGQNQWDPAVAQSTSGEPQTYTGTIGGGGFLATYRPLNASSGLTSLVGLSGRALGDSNCAGTITRVRCGEFLRPRFGPATLPTGTATADNVQTLYVEGPEAGWVNTAGNIALFLGYADQHSDFVIRSCPVRIDDSITQSNNAVSGRWVDIYRTWDGDASEFVDGAAGAATTVRDQASFFVGAHATLDIKGTFTADDDASGFRSLARTGTDADDGTNLGRLIGYEAVVQHRASGAVTIDEMYGFDALPTSNSSGTITTMAGFRSLLTNTAGTITNSYGFSTNCLTPSASYGSVGHLFLSPVTVTDNTDIKNLTAEQEGAVILLKDTNTAANNGLYVYLTVGATTGWYRFTLGAAI